EEYYQHHEDVLSYFKNRPQDLLVINVCAGDGWEKLCSFLKLPVPNKLFPHVNKKTFFILMKYHLRKVLPILFKFSIVRKMNNWRKKRNYF
ncbi:MAG: hypothetical protein KKH40_03100, partial [Nanoarchaeota archaeon]|nr:hypothetical protein [Nanoarchaeota archaeon]